MSQKPFGVPSTRSVANASGPKNTGCSYFTSICTRYCGTLETVSVQKVTTGLPGQSLVSSKPWTLSWRRPVLQEPGVVPHSCCRTNVVSVPLQSTTPVGSVAATRRPASRMAFVRPISLSRTNANWKIAITSMTRRGVTSASSRSA
jgi:hypothetical protein